MCTSQCRVHVHQKPSGQVCSSLCGVSGERKNLSVSTTVWFPDATIPPLPWYNCNGWLGVKHQVSYLLFQQGLSDWFRPVPFPCPPFTLRLRRRPCHPLRYQWIFCVPRVWLWWAYLWNTPGCGFSWTCPLRVGQAQKRTDNTGVGGLS